MLRVIRTAEQLNYWQTMFVYEESNTEAAKKIRNCDCNEALLIAEQDFYTYLTDVFFATPGAFIAFWEQDGRAVSAVRVEPHEDGVILTGLETAIEYRCAGYAGALLQEVLTQLACIVYSHVHKENVGSLKVHSDCGFEIIRDECVFLDGSRSKDYYTLRYVAKEKYVDK